MKGTIKLTKIADIIPKNTDNSKIKPFSPE